MFGASFANGRATWRVTTSQSGCLTFGSQRTNQRRQSAIRQSFVAGRPLATSAQQCALASQRTTARSRGIRHRYLALEGGRGDLLETGAVSTNLRCHRPK
jgi:hypothetical protein